MPDFEAVEVLTQAKERLFEHGWGRGCSTTRISHGDPESMCIEDALCGERGQFSFLHQLPSIRRAGSYVRIVLDAGKDLWAWNDEQKTAGPVFECLDRAVLMAKEARTPEA